MTKARELFEILEDGGSGLAGAGEARLSEREAKLLVGALNYHSLVQPGREFRAIVLRAPDGHFPQLTGYACHRREWDSNRVVVCTVSARSTVEPPPGQSDSLVIPLVLDLGGERAEGGASYYDRPGRKAKLLKLARFGAPIAFDALRQGLTDYHEKRITPYRRPARLAPIPSSSPLQRQADGDEAIVFGLHWLEMGGAERWALETIALAREAGFLPIVLTDRESSHPWITRNELDGALVLPMNVSMSDAEETALLLGLLSRYSIRGIHVHHNSWLYHRLAWFKAMNPQIQIVDSLHVVEWRTGGFVEQSIKLSNAIDVHHVISPQLRDYMVLQRDVPKERVSLAPLYGLNNLEAGPDARKAATGPFTISFVGRLSQQKRPYLFLRYAAQLKRSLAGREVQFILHGSGALADETSRLIAKYDLTDILEWRQPPRSVEDTLADSDLLVISSDNEGLTLTTFEATAHNVAVLSTDVGSQASLVSNKALVPRQPLAFIKEAVNRTKEIIGSQELREQIVEEQRQKIAALRELPEAREWTAKLYEGWKV